MIYSLDYNISMDSGKPRRCAGKWLNHDQEVLGIYNEQTRFLLKCGFITFYLAGICVL